MQDDFSFLLAGDTFASGRLTNPTPAMWTHFETMQVTMRPTYMSAYFPAQGLVLGAGRLLFGSPWVGLLCVNALMCAAITWMLQAWLPPRWALLGGSLSVLRIALFSYWIDTYSGGGSIAALGGALLLGGLPRFLRAQRFRDALWMGVGVSLLAISRPFEGLLLFLPVGFILARQLFSVDGQPGRVVLLRRLALPSALVLLTIAWMGHYDQRAFGSPFTPPYSVDRATYAVVPYYIWQSPRKAPFYRHAELQQFYSHVELGYFRRLRTPYGLLSESLFFKPLRITLFYAGVALAPPLMMWRRVLLDRRTRFLVVCLLILILGMLSETFLIPHYLAPFAAGLYALGLQAMRHLRVWKLNGAPVGRSIVHLSLWLCFALATARVFAAPLHLDIGSWPGFAWQYRWSGPGDFGARHARVQALLAEKAGLQLAIVRYSKQHDSTDEWVYNAPDIDHSKVIWAREMSPAENLDLIRYYKDRKVWLVEPDLHPVEIAPYPVPQAGAGESASTAATLAR